MFAVQVGQEVGFCRVGNWGNLHSTGFGVITKINGYGHITVTTVGQDGVPKVRVFNKHGDERGTSYGVSLIQADYLRTRIADTEARRLRNHAAKELQAKLQGMFSYSGDFHIDDAKKAELIAMVQAL